ncbi:hypothetical protein [Polymorphospora rubra]|uniref:Uncharacterized protein n=1 Tax=Polymorphospora rubra TaxID=338584 RepID=A0A810MYA5_9ACTN|nr:hypothetical protein [Polymorphospora rubra]BCJ65560.1 hypothetical protein Prubr_25810 [Polymorphospora rubra]
MSHDSSTPPTDDHRAAPAVAQWGDDEPTGGSRVSRLLTALGRDHRLAPVVGGLSLLAVFASFAGEWVVATLDIGGIGSEPLVLTAGLVRMDAIGAGYLLGVFVVVGCAALALFGDGPVRHNARVVGFAAGGTTLAVLVAATTVGEQAVDRSYFAPQGSIEVEQGRGLVMAFVGTLGLLLTLYLIGRLAPVVVRPAPARDDRNDAPAEPAPGPVGDWPWRRPRRSPEPADPDAPMIDVTVAPAAPFIRPDRGEPR